MNGWIKLHRQIMANPMWQRDHTAMHLFLTLLLTVDKRTGSCSQGRFQLADKSGLKPVTVYKALTRLKNAKMVTLSSNNKYTVISICNWEKYQASVTPPVTTKEQQSNTKQEYRIEKEYIYAQVKEIHELYQNLFDTPKSSLTSKRQQVIAERLGDCGQECVSQALRKASHDDYYLTANRGGVADIAWILRSAEEVERLASINLDMV